MRLEGTKITASAFRVVVVGAGLLGAMTLTGCGTFYPTLQKIEVDTSKTTPAEQSEELLKTAVTLRTEYANGFNQSSKIVDISALPILGAAAAAAGLLLFDGSTAALKAVALGAGTYTAGRLLFVPQATPELYLNAHSAVSCVMVEGNTLTENAELLQKQAQEFANQIAEARAALATSIPPTQDDEVHVGAANQTTNAGDPDLQNARSDLLQEITNADEALAKAAAAMGAYKTGPQTIANAPTGYSSSSRPKNTRRAVDFILRCGFSYHISLPGSQRPPSRSSDYT